MHTAEPNTQHWQWSQTYSTDSVVWDKLNMRWCPPSIHLSFYLSLSFLLSLSFSLPRGYLIAIDLRIIFMPVCTSPPHPNQPWNLDQDREWGWLYCSWRDGGVWLVGLGMGMGREVLVGESLHGNSRYRETEGWSSRSASPQLQQQRLEDNHHQHFSPFSLFVSLFRFSSFSSLLHTQTPFFILSFFLSFFLLHTFCLDLTVPS